MNYEKIYYQIIENAKLHQEERITLHSLDKKKYYFEGHHIIPKSLGGDGNSRHWCKSYVEKRHPNIVGLTPKEHFVCHKLLCRIYPNNKSLTNALWRMVCRPRDFQMRHIPSGKEYESIRQEFIKNHHNSTSEGRRRCAISITGDKNPMFGKTHSDEYKDLLKRKMKGHGNPFYGKKHSTESINIIKESIKNRGGHRGGKNPRAVPVVVYGVRYECIKDAMINLKITKNKVKSLNELK